MSELYESIGRNPADCTVCAAPTLLRLAVGDGCAPICSACCERAWPNVQKMLENAGRAETRAHAAETEAARLRDALATVRASLCTLEHEDDWAALEGTIDEILRTPHATDTKEDGR